jgi:hypothetical protein
VQVSRLTGRNILFFDSLNYISDISQLNFTQIYLFYQDHGYWTLSGQNRCSIRRFSQPTSIEFLKEKAHNASVG